ncbi:MAG TPA: adenylyltransferase/cytidyltransferase family protein [Vitreimonas sp.]|nr:adenylyltransferase/cytidyltransferase family protein [Vitreimonas sp.]
MSEAKKTVLVTGVFDILHHEHVEFLQKAKALGDELVVGIESDVRVAAIKGPGRPINTAAIRKTNLENLGLADEVFILPEAFDKPEHHEALIAQYHPDFLAVSSHTAHLDKKQALLAKYGGQVVVVHDHNPAVSTTQLLQQQTKA